MQGKEKTQVKVGLFVFGTLIFTMYVIFMLGGDKQLFQRRFTLNASFKDISGLRVGAPIQLAGLKVGYVDRIGFASDLSDKNVDVTLKVNKRFQKRIREDSVAEINTQGLLGDKYIFISVGSDDKNILKDGDIIQSKESSSLYTLASKSGEIIDDIKETASAARQFFTDMHTSKDNVKDMLDSLKNIMNQAESGDGLVHALLYDPKGKEVVADIAQSMKSLKEIVGSVDEENKKDGAVSGILKNLNVASKDMKEIVSRVNQGEGTIGGLVTDPSVYNDLRSLMGRANRNKLLKSIIRSTLSENDKSIEN